MTSTSSRDNAVRPTGAHAPLERDTDNDEVLPADVADYIFQSSAAFMILVRSTDRYRRRAAIRAGLSVIDLQALRRISEGEVVTPKDVGTTLELTTGAVTALLDRLENAGLVSRAPHPRDRRSIQLRLTADGAEKMVAVYADFQNLFLRALRDMPREDVLAATELMKRVDAAIQATN